ncbi:hypothetical protein ACFX2A_004622 [Malus domestica]
MPAIFVLSTGIRPIIIVTSLLRPCCNCVTRLPISTAAPEEVLAKFAVRMNQGAVFLPLVRPPRSVFLQFSVPFERAETEP